MFSKHIWAAAELKWVIQRKCIALAKTRFDKPSARNTIEEAA